MTVRITTLNKNLRNMYYSLMTEDYSTKRLDKTVEKMYQDFKHSKYMRVFNHSIATSRIRNAEMFLPAEDSIENTEMRCLSDKSKQKQAYLNRVNYVKNYNYKWFLPDYDTKVIRTITKSGDVNIHYTVNPISPLNKEAVLDLLQRLGHEIYLLRKGYSYFEIETGQVL